MAEELPSKIKTFLREDLTDSNMTEICGILRDERETRFGRNILEKIGNSPYVLYDEMSRRGCFTNNNYSTLIRILEKAKLVDVATGVKEIISEHQQSSGTAGRPHTLQIMPQDNGDAASSEYHLPGVVSPDHPTRSIPPARDSKNYYLSTEDRWYSFRDKHGYYRKGLVAIVNNFTTRQAVKYRYGTIVDQKNIESLFKSEGFRQFYEVDAHTDLNKDAFLRTLSGWVEKLNDNEDKYNSFFLFILSHGVKGGVEAYYTEKISRDDNVIPIDDITDMFKDCLLDRPKVIVVQACQGDQEMVQPDSSVSQSAAEIVESDYPTFKPPSHADMLTAMATIQGFQALRSVSEEPGSWFIKVLIGQLRSAHKHMFSTHLLDILTEVQLVVSMHRGCLSSPDSIQQPDAHRRQMPCFQSTLRKKFYLLPPRLPYSYP